MKKFILALSILLSASIACHSQIYVDNQGNVYDQRQTTTTTSTTSKTAVKSSGYSSGSKFDASKLTFGGNLSLQFGDYTVVGISPQVGYDFNKYFTAGAGLGYTYYKDKYYDYKWNASYLSFDLFGRVYPIEYIVLGIQPEISRMWQTIDYYGAGKVSESKFVPSFLVGAGLRFQGMIAMIQYDVVQDKHSPYGNNIFYSVGYTFRF
ncbi:hypothetical protein M2451_002856 [Dysgonomonas sp. PFB1-18]|uniref:hypothetical protein n=1 Tax=unclassified Dysgonomonas TaxID=2630389 RepID=UPI002476D029|nr:MULTISPECIES: hypothetical protein [unclassified Dysgonomonas]MDH6309966.1 hypothetical protein [Dysgonomonas sp. PF1-14]MDH6339875.1 hypothetical protein [Dysgonomonas sp. PF1-16]MDH6381523.1 hypothetical protein [Dysgonomonas sp. PFB1-18]MDH6398840.1 hypothetical protein [Dysgonomonas sp. PF1-23]